MKGILILLADNGFIVEYGEMAEHLNRGRVKKIAPTYNDMLRVLDEGLGEFLHERRFQGNLVDKPQPTPPVSSER